MDASLLQFNPSDPTAWRDQLVHGGAPEAERLAAASREFEAVLLRQYLTEALKPLTAGGQTFGTSNPVYGYLITDALASGLSADGVFGFSNMLQAQLAGSQETHDEPSSDNL